MFKKAIPFFFVAALALCFASTEVRAEGEAEMPAPCCDVKPCVKVKCCDDCCCKIVCCIKDYQCKQRRGKCIITYKKVIKKVCCCDCDCCCCCEKVIKVERVRKVVKCKPVCCPKPCCPAPCTPCC